MRANAQHPFVLVYATRSVLERARELGIAQLECQVASSVRAGRKRKLERNERSVMLADGTIAVCRKGVGLLGTRKALHVTRIIPRPARPS
jgi:hypothetical protein